VRLRHGALLLLFALVVTSRTVAAGDWPENYILHEHSESPDGRYGVLVLSQQAAIDQDKTDGNITYLANLHTRETLDEIRDTDYFENQNHRDLQVVWAPDSSTCVLQYDGRYGFDSVFVLELKDESFRQIDIGKHIQKTLDRLFEGYVSAYFRFAPDHKLKVRALSFTNPKALPDQPSNYAVFQGTFDSKAGKWTHASAKKTEEYDALQAAYQDDSAKQMIVAANPADVPENFTGSVFSSEQEKLDALDKMMNDVYQAVRSVLAADRFTKVKQDQIAWLKTRDAAQSLEAKWKLTESRITKLQELLW
jgi:uncharacterized protein YecT (DUF1311 family)